MELFLVAGDEQQRIIGRRTHDEDEHDPLALARQVDVPALGQWEDDETGQGQAENG